MTLNLLNKSKDQYSNIIEKISSEQSAVGIDAQYTHAVIIEYLQLLDERIANIERAIEKGLS